MTQRDNKIKFHEYNKQVFTEAKQPMDQIKAEPVRDMELKNFIELERKKFKKSDDINEIINQLK